MTCLKCYFQKQKNNLNVILYINIMPEVLNNHILCIFYVGFISTVYILLL